jgi:dihydroorotase
MTLDHLFDTAAKADACFFIGTDTAPHSGEQTLPWIIGEIRP